METSNINKILIGAVAVLLIIVGYQNLGPGDSDNELNSSASILGIDNETALTDLEKGLNDAITQIDPAYSSGSAPETNAKTTIYIPLIKSGNIKDEMDGELVGCGDRLEFIPKEVPYTKAPLTATYQAMFAMDRDVTLGERQYSNEIGAQTDFIHFAKATIVNNIATIYLEGTPASNECADPRLEAQIRRAATQFPNITEVRTMLNNQPFNWSTFGNQKGV